MYSKNLSFLGFLVLGCSSTPSPPKPVKPIESAPVVVQAQPSSTPIPTPPAPQAGPTPTERLGKFLGQLAVIDQPETLLLGVETVPSTGYGSLYGEGAHAPPEDKLHTFVIQFRDGRAELVGELPFLAIPQEKGFLYMGVASYERDDTELERERQGEKFGFDDEYGSKVYWYVASSLWRTIDRSKVDAVRKAKRRQLEGNRKWGDLSGEDVNYVTPRALCTTQYSAEWTGGALAFRAHEEQALEGLVKKLPPTLNKYTDDAGLLNFARTILEQREPGQDHTDIPLDKPYDMGWAKVNWRKDSRACLARENGQVMLTGVIRLPNNSARSSEWEASVKVAPPELASQAPPAIAFSDINRSFAVPKPLDALVSPRKTILIAQWKDRFAMYGAKQAVPLLTIPLSGRVVMAEWADGDAASVWARVGDAPKTPTSLACACDVGTICAENKCVKPKTVFVTSTLYDGNLGGLPGADAKCQERAKAAELDGDFKAWLSDSNTSAASRLSHSNVPYVLVDGTIIAKDWSAWASGDHLAPIRRTEFGQWPASVASPPGCARSIVWTNTNEDGTIAAKERSCSDWTDGTSSPNPAKGGQEAVWGRADDDYKWSSQCKSNYAGCNGKFPLFCVEQ